MGGSVGSLTVLVLAAMAVFFITKKYRSGSSGKADSGADSRAATATPTYNQVSLNTSTHDKSEREPSPLSRNTTVLGRESARDSVSVMSRNPSTHRPSTQSSSTLVGHQQGTGSLSGQPGTIQEISTDQAMHEMGAGYMGHETATSGYRFQWHEGK